MIITTFITNILSHTVKMPFNEELECIPKNVTKGFPPAISWHVHIIYMLTNKAQTERAISFLNTVRNHFRDYLGRDCPNRYDNTQFCVITDHPLNTTLEEGPFPIGEWSLWVPPAYFGLVVPWMSQNRGEFTLLVHPNTGCPYEDHSDWAFWVGDKWNLDLSIFDKGEHNGERGHTPGDKTNPTCISTGFNCGSLDWKGPAMACCEQNMCICKNQFVYGTRCSCEKVKQTNLSILE